MIVNYHLVRAQLMSIASSLTSYLRPYSQQDTLGMGNDEMSEIFNEWNQGELDSFLIEISTAILKYKDDKGEFLLENIRDATGQKGTGKWTAISALEYGMPVTLIGESVCARCLSSVQSKSRERKGKLDPEGPI